MKNFTVKIEVKLKSVVLDPQGKAVLSALNNLGFDNVSDARVGKLIEIKINDDSKDSARGKADEMCKKLLANPVIEDYSLEVLEN